MSESYNRLGASLLLLLVLSLLTGCATSSSYQTEKKTPDAATNLDSGKKPDQEKVDPVSPRVISKVPSSGVTGVAPSPSPTRNQVSQPVKPPPPENQIENTAKMSMEDMLDLALEYCEAANSFWERGELDSAVDALDKAFALILKVETDDDPNLLQQKEDLRLTISKRIVEVYASRYTVANGISKAIPLVMNQHVMKELESFKTRERDFFLNAFRRSGRYRPAIVKALREAGFPEELSWLPLIESGFKVRALSTARALGMWQFIASTGYRFGLKRDNWIDERMDSEKATQGAIAYLRELHQIFGDWTTALAAYNCGEYAVLNRIKTQKINYLDNFWDLYEKLPRETAAYVPRFMAVLHIVNNPAAYGMTLPPLDEEMEWEEVMVDKQVELKTIAEHLQIPYETLEGMNAELRRNLTPEGAYPLRVPVGMGEVLLSKMDAIPAWCPPVHAYIVHKVKRGETVKSISARYKVFPEDIMSLNSLKRGGPLKQGMKLKIPAEKEKTVAQVKKPSVKQTVLEEKPIKYVVKKGDSLFEIANRFNANVKEIQSQNKLKNADIRVGQVLWIPPAGKENCPPGDIKNYTVKEGDSLFIIARKHQMNLVDVLKLNNLTPQSTIFPGQELQVRANGSF
jgi:peptidoglycan lytic transglycosylase D